MATFNVKNLNTINQLPELTAFALQHNIDIICLQGHHDSERELKYHDIGNGWTFVSTSAWENSVNATIEMLLSPRALKSLNSIERNQPGIMCVRFNGNLYTTIISGFSLTNANDELNITTLYDGLSSFVRHIHKHNILIIDGDINAHMGKEENHKFCSYNLPNRKSECVTDFSLENSLSCLKARFQKSKGKLWTYAYPNNA